MNVFTCHWLPRSARHGLLTLAVAALCLTGALLSRPSLPATVAIAVTHPAPSAETAAAHEWPRAALRLWFILPQILSHDS
jgi:hypothetical protein